MRWLSHTRTFDAFSNWFLLLVGASFTLVVPNIAAVVTIVPGESIRAFLLLLIISAFCGIAQKLFATKIDIRLQLAEALDKDIFDRLNEAKKEEGIILQEAWRLKTTVTTAIDFRRVLKTVVSTYPYWLRKNALEKSEMGFRDPLYMFKDASREFWKQSFWFVCQIILLLVAFMVVALNIKII